MAKQHVKEWQEYLNSTGASLTVDGVMGKLTLDASYKAVGKPQDEDIKQDYEWYNKATGQVTEHFNVSEFKCRDGTDVPEELYDTLWLLCAKLLEPLRERLSTPITVLSGYRTQEYNDKIYSKKNTNSVHISCGAIDPRFVEHEKAQLECVEMYHDGDIGGLGLTAKSSSYDHVDIRHLIPYVNSKAIWCYGDKNNLYPSVIEKLKQYGYWNNIIEYK